MELIHKVDFPDKYVVKGGESFVFDSDGGEVMVYDGSKFVPTKPAAEKAVSLDISGFVNYEKPDSVEAYFEYDTDGKLLRSPMIRGQVDFYEHEKLFDLYTHLGTVVIPLKMDSVEYLMSHGPVKWPFDRFEPEWDAHFRFGGFTSISDSFPTYEPFAGRTLTHYTVDIPAYADSKSKFEAAKVKDFEGQFCDDDCFIEIKHPPTVGHKGWMSIYLYLNVHVDQDSGKMILNIVSPGVPGFR